jgi:hypothetical protein
MALENKDKDFNFSEELGLSPEALQSAGVEQDKPVVEETPVSPPVSAPPPPVSEAAPKVEVPVAPPIVEVPVSKEPEVGSKEYYEKVIDGLRSTVESLASGSLRPPTAPAAPPAPETVRPVVEPSRPPVQPSQQLAVEIPDVDFVGNQTLDTVLDSKEGLNKMLNQVYKAGIAFATEQAVTKAHERTLLSLPDVVTKYVTQSAVLRNVREEFYSKNDDLKPFQSVVAHAANTISSEHPDWDVPKVLAETATTVRKALGIMQKASVIPPATPSGTNNLGPAFPTGTGGRGGAPVSLDKLAKEVNELIS